MNGRLDEHDRFTALGSLFCLRITDEVINEVTEVLGKEKGLLSPQK